MSGYPPALEPVLANHAATRRLVPQMFDTLIAFDHGNRMALRPALVEQKLDLHVVLAGTGRCSVTLLGGVVKAATRTLVGPDVLRALEQRVFDLAVCGASAVDAMHGFLGPAIGTTLAQRSNRLAFVVDATKFGRIDAHVVQPFTTVDALATNLPPPPAIAAALETAGVALHLGGFNQP